MKINVKKISGDFHMEASNDDGNLLEMDGSKDIGGEGKGMRPMQLLLAAVGGCSSIDVLLMLKKQKQEVDSFEVEVEGHTEKVEDHKLFKEIVLHFKLTGKVEMEKAARAVQLSMEKYCSVSKTLEPTAKITYKVTVNHFTIKELHASTSSATGDSTSSATGEEDKKEGSVSDASTSSETKEKDASKDSATEEKEEKTEEASTDPGTEDKKTEADKTEAEKEDTTDET